MGDRQAFWDAVFISAISGAAMSTYDSTTIEERAKRLANLAVITRDALLPKAAPRTTSRKDGGT